MQRLNKSILWVLLLASTLQTSWAYSLAGPYANSANGDYWQVTAIGYGPPVDAVAPKNLGEEYRRNIPVMFYAFDQTFKDYFGPEGMGSVHDAFSILNSLTNVNDYSTQLSEVPLETRQQNYQAQALGLYDLKSFTLYIMMEQLGLADPVHYAWTLHDRWHVGNIACPVGMEYYVVQRNFDTVSSPLNQLQYSPYVNNTLYSYDIFEVCSGSPVLAQTIPFSVDPLADSYSPLASQAITWGDYYTGLTRDDVAGLRYLLDTNNVNWETIPDGSFLESITTNKFQPESFPPPQFSLTNSVGTNSIGFYYFSGNTNGGFGYGDLAALISYARTNNLTNLTAAYPGIIVTSYSNTLVRATNETYSYYVTNAGYGSAYPPPQTIAIATNYTAYWQPIYYYQFANVFTNHFYTNATGYIQTISIAPPTGAAYGTPAVTNYNRKATNVIAGDFFVLPLFATNVCPLDIIDSSLFNVVAKTNYLSVGSTNFVTDTNAIGLSNSVALVTYFTNYSFAINPVTCTDVASNTDWYQGVGKIKYVYGDFEASYDPLLAQYTQPITNFYTMVVKTDNQYVTRLFKRIITRPDFVFSANDLTTGPPDDPVHANFVFNVTEPGFYEGNILPGLAGPGTIVPSTDITFNKDGPVYFNSFGDVMDGTPYFNQTPGGDINNFYYFDYFIWASFDGTTNAPVVFANGTSIDNLENQVLIQLTPKTLPNGYEDVPYPAQTFTATGGYLTPPYTWAASGLPSGLAVSPGGVLSGTPTQTGTFDFTLKMTDSLARSVQWGYTITIQ